MQKFITKTQNRWNQSDRNLRFFIIGILLLGINGGILTSTFNNYLSDTYNLSAVTRGQLEFWREMPGFILIFITGFLALVPVKYWAVAVSLLSSIGLFGLAFQPGYLWIMSVWMMLWSLGEHLFMPVESTVGLLMSKEGMQGRRLGQISGYRNLSMIFGAGIVWLAGYLLLDHSGAATPQTTPPAYYTGLYIIAGIAALLSIFAFAKMQLPKNDLEQAKRFVVKKKYSYYYILSVLFGARKQIFLTFAPWLLITVFHTGPEKIALLMIVASILGVIFRQAFGVLTDKIGEVKMFMGDAVILLFICIGFAWSKNLWLLYFLFIMDNLMFATRIARTTYLNKITTDKKDLPATISFGISIDHIVSMTIPFLGGLLWKFYGYSSVFFAASLLSVLGFVVSVMIGRKFKFQKV